MTDLWKKSCFRYGWIYIPGAEAFIRLSSKKRYNWDSSFISYPSSQHLLTDSIEERYRPRQSSYELSHFEGETILLKVSMRHEAIQGSLARSFTRVLEGQSRIHRFVGYWQKFGHGLSMKTGLIRLICIVRLVLLESVVYYMGYWGKTEIAGIDAGMVKWL